jgi:hypothetical protein
MWEVHCQFSKPSAEGNSTELEWSAVRVDTQAEAEVWWRLRTGVCSTVRRVHTMRNPNGEVVRVRVD